MFEGIQRSLGEALKRLRGKGKITEANIKDGLREVKRALLEADVNFNVVNSFVTRVTEKSVGQEVLRSVDPSEQIVKIVYDELVALMGPVDHKIRYSKTGPTVLMLCGLQGAGKTTTAGKLALNIRAQGKRPLLVAADLQRPAAVEQLRTLGAQLDIPVYSEAASPVDVCKNAVAFAKQKALDVVILDTAGRLHIAEMPMEELRQIEKSCRPEQVFLVCDAMTGQDAVNSAKSFNDALELDGVILTKMDGDARGGAALSIKEVTGVRVKFVGVGEKLDKLEEFHPERMAQRIMGQGDLMGLVEKISAIQANISQEELQRQRAKLEKGDFTLDDFRTQFANLQKMGMKDMLSRIPGMSEMIPEGEDPELALKRVQGMIDSMTRDERKNPDLIDLSRRRRIAAGAGIEPSEIKQFLQQFSQMRLVMRQMANMSIMDRVRMMTGLGKAGVFNPGGANVLKSKVGTGHRKSARERAEERKKKKKK